MAIFFLFGAGNLAPLLPKFMIYDVMYDFPISSYIVSMQQNLNNNTVRDFMEGYTVPCWKTWKKYDHKIASIFSKIKCVVMKWSSWQVLIFCFSFLYSAAFLLVQ